MIFEWERYLFNIINSIDINILNIFFKTISNRIFLIIMFSLISVYFFLTYKKSFFIFFLLLVVGVGIVDFIGNLLKYLYKIPRPCSIFFNFESYKCLEGLKRSFSFPSNHVITWGYITIFLFLFIKEKVKSNKEIKNYLLQYIIYLAF